MIKEFTPKVMLKYRRAINKLETELDDNENKLIIMYIELNQLHTDIAVNAYMHKSSSTDLIVRILGKLYESKLSLAKCKHNYREAQKILHSERMSEIFGEDYSK